MPELEVGRVIRPHGLQGEVIVELTTDRDERMAPGVRLGAERGGERLTLEVGRARQQQAATDRRYARWIVQFEGYHGREIAESLRGVALVAGALDDPDELWTHELVGAEVRLAYSGEPVGECVGVIANPASDLLELDTGALVPVVFVVDVAVDGSAARVTIDPPPGLLEL